MNKTAPLRFNLVSSLRCEELILSYRQARIIRTPGVTAPKNQAVQLLFIRADVDLPVAIDPRVSGKVQYADYGRTQIGTRVHGR
jgi:hypothetical protein